MTAEEQFASNLRRYREHVGWSQSDLAKLMAAAGFKWHPATVYSVEKGERKIPLNEVVAIARLLHVSVDSLIRPTKVTERRILADRLYESFRQSALRLLAAADAYETQRRQMRGLISQVNEGKIPEPASVTRIAMGHLLNLSAHELVNPDFGTARQHAISSVNRVGSDRQQAQEEAERIQSGDDV